MADQITLECSSVSPESLIGLLVPVIGPEAGELKLVRYRSLESAVLVAVVGSLGAAVGALISGILRIAEQRGTAKIVLQGRSGRRIEVPVNTPADKIQTYIEHAKELDIELIQF